MADQFCLRWNNFQTNIVSALDSLKCSEDLVDVTLTCDGRNIKAHKVILSACSPYFRNVFKENPCQHPVIILKDVPAEDIVNLLSYMYQGEVFIEESKLSSFLHTAALLQVKGLTGVTQKENFTSQNTSNKLYSQLTISSKSQHNSPPKDVKTYVAKKRRCSTSDKPSVDVFAENYKKNKSNDVIEVQNKLKNDILPVVLENHNDKHEQPLAMSNGKSSSLIPVHNDIDTVPVTIKTENTDDSNHSVHLPTPNSDNEDSLPDYENSMLARSLLQGINPSKGDLSANSNKKVPNVCDLRPSRPKDVITDTVKPSAALKSPPKDNNNDEVLIKSERKSPKHDTEYEPEVLLSEHQDGNGSVDYGQEQSQAFVLLSGMSSVSVLGTGASTSQGTSHQSNHAAICGDCPHCGMKYSNQSALKYHVRLMHSDLTNRLCCYLCPRSFTMRETFKEHMWSSHGQRN